MLSSHDDAAQLANIQCENCHGPNQSGGHMVPKLFGADGVELHSYPLLVDAGMVEQDTEPFADAGYDDLGWGFAEVEVVSGTGILTSASVVDSLTNDATTIPMKR